MNGVPIRRPGFDPDRQLRLDEKKKANILSTSTQYLSLSKNYFPLFKKILILLPIIC
ncbi:hypothetical protein RHGRI_001842 [Rhododendron griersonianum]|uniref:Uncharacterized protein n=1 Tax=Rhododendron griersonianum TaxID=479676 RepID=A0AAV6LMV8_9ERIC|nr:hypothetical protein RHGRI_001842 [Rhododendron griersonianum]